MSTSDAIRQLESKLEAGKRDLREDASQISDKIEETKAKLSPTDFVRKESNPRIGCSFAVGL
jgi:hypothetical protein